MPELSGIGMMLEHTCIAVGEPTLAQKVAFLGDPKAYPHPVSDVVLRETHMSWVFLAGDRVYKLKKPVHFAYLDFSTLERRELACKTEVNLNRRLAPDVYIGAVPITQTGNRLSVGGSGVIIDWLVVMRRLAEHLTLEQALRENRLEKCQLDRLAARLVRFYRRARPVFTAHGHVFDWANSLTNNRRTLLNPRFGLPLAHIRYIDRVQHRFVTECRPMLAARVRDGRIIDGHGDLRPEHIWLDREIRIIDCLEFNARLREVDPFDEIAFLDLECARQGVAWAGRYLRTRICYGLHDQIPPELYHFYRSYRAMLRARLAIAHLAEPNPRTPEKWPRVANSYLDIAAGDAGSLARLLRTPSARQGFYRHGGARLRRPAGAQWAGCGACRMQPSRPDERLERYR